MKSQFNADKSALTRREFMRLSALTAGGLLAARCSPAATPTSAAPIAAATESVVSDGITRGGRFVLGTPQPIQTLDPHAFGIFNNRNAWPGLWNGLFRYDADMIPQPDLVTSWEVSPDGLTYTFQLQENVLFHNGRPMTAEDVKFSIERVLDPDTLSANYGTSVSAVDQVTVIDDHTVEFSLSSTSATLIPGLARVMIVAPENADDIANSAIGTGPYKLNEYVVGEQLVLAVCRREKIDC